MKYVTAGLLLAAMALLGVILYQTDLIEVWNRLHEIGGWGIAVILIIYFIASWVQTLSWHLTLPSARLEGKWLYSLWKVLIVGQALNNVTPLASVGGEPLKVALLKSHHAIDYREAAASLILQQTVQNIGFLPFLLIGFSLMLGVDALPPHYQLAAGSGLAIFSLCISLFFLVQRYKILSLIGGFLGKNRLGTRLLTWLELIHEFEDRLIAFYSDRRRFVLVVTIEFIIWMLGVVEVYYALRFLGHPITFGDAWVIMAVVELVRSTLFFVPANIGTQEGTFVVICGAITGSSALGLAVALIVRFREILWIFVGLVLGWVFSLSTPQRGDLSKASRYFQDNRTKPVLIKVVHRNGDIDEE